MLHEKAKSAGITILGEMGLDPGIGMISHNIVSFKIVFSLDLPIMHISSKIFPG